MRVHARAAAPGEGLPVVVVDEEIYRLLPALLIATVDKFAQMPWEGATQALFGQVDAPLRAPRLPARRRSSEHAEPAPSAARRAARGDDRRCEPLRPPDLIIQDELHLIAGPLGTLVGLYETAVDELCDLGRSTARRVRPKVIASTATIRRAGDQVAAAVRPRRSRSSRRRASTLDDIVLRAAARPPMSDDAAGPALPRHLRAGPAAQGGR